MKMAMAMAMAMAKGGMSLLVCSFLAAMATAAGDDEAALLAFKAAEVSDAGGSLASWNSSAGFCGWEGVACSRRKPARVVAPRLNGAGLAGALSPAIGNLTFLRTLNLSSNSLRGGIPASLGRLRLLQRLYMDGNSFSGTFPVNLSSCVGMTEMVLDKNELGGRIPPELGEKLTSLTADGDVAEQQQLHGACSCVPSLANCSRLQVLVLSNNCFGGQLPAGSVVNLSTTLQRLYLQDNSIYGSIPADIGNLVGLKILVIANTYMSGVIPKSIGKLQNLNVLSLYNNSLSGLIYTTIARKPLTVE